MIILALDQALSRSGWAVLESRPMRQAKYMGSGWFASQGEDVDAKVNAFIDHADQLILDYGPALLVWEKPSKFMARPGGVTSRTLVLTRLDQALRDLAKLRNINIETVAANTWRAAVFGRGGGRLSTADAKARAMQWCGWLDITVRDDNQAEAVCIGFWACAWAKTLEALR